MTYDPDQDRDYAEEAANAALLANPDPNAVPPLTEDEMRTLLATAADLLQAAKPESSHDRGVAMTWGRRRKALVNRLIDAEVWPR